MKTKKLSLTLILALLVVNTFAQKSFVKGYIVDNADNKTDCLIRNMGNAESSMKYVYQLEGDEEITAISLAKIKEFGIDGGLKCIRALIAIDISDEVISRPEEAEKGPEWDEGHAYLKVLVEGELATLYSFFSEGEETFYYRIDTSAIQPLYHKEYRVEITPGVLEQKIKDNTFREQLKNNLSCANNSRSETVDYTRKGLIKYFEDFHNCKSGKYQTPELSQFKKGKFVFKAGASFNQMDMSAKDLTTGSAVSFSKENSFGFGVEAEYIFAFNNYKWSVFAEANYYSYYSDYSNNTYNSQHDGYVADYKTIEVPLGINYNMYLNADNRIFVKVAYVPHFILNESSIKFKSEADYKYSEATRTFAAIGYSYKRLSGEVRFYSKHNITQNIYQRGTDYSQLSFRLSYTLLKSK